MKISLEWLREYLPGASDAQAFADALTHGGLPVEVIERHGDDTVIDVEVTSNRGDCLSHVGMARELSALLNREVLEKKTGVTSGLSPSKAEVTLPASSVTSVAIEASDLCPHYTARVLRNVKVQPSPPWMARRLEAIGVRAINNIVDVTNYVLFETGQPLHAFDFDKLDGKRIVVRRAAAGEKIVSIDGHERALATDMLVIADARRPVALAGVMGGRDSEVSANTVNVLLESARFDPLSVRKTARSLAMKSDSSYRFERGIDPSLPERASLRAAQLILETAGGELMAGMVSAGESGAKVRTLTLRLAKLKRVLGVEFPIDVVKDALTRLRLNPIVKGDAIDVTIPTYRLDLNIESDLIEEVARIVGYDKIPVRDEISIRLTPPDPAAEAVQTIRLTIVASGYFEAVTFGFVSDLLASDFLPPEAGGLSRADASVRKADAGLRPSLLPGLLEAARRNETVGNTNVKLFESGSTFWQDSAGKVVERRRLGLVGSDDLREVRGVVEILLSTLDRQRDVRVIPDARPGYAAGASGRIEWGCKPIGHLGKLDRAVADKLGLRSLPAIAELEMAELIAGDQQVPQLQPLPRFPAVRRDLSLVMAERTKYQELESLVRDATPEQLEEIEYVTTYRGKQVEKGQKSVTITLVFRSATATLTGEEVEGAVQKVVAAAKEKLGATLRT